MKYKRIEFDDEFEIIFDFVKFNHLVTQRIQLVQKVRSISNTNESCTRSYSIYFESHITLDWFMPIFHECPFRWLVRFSAIILKHFIHSLIERLCNMNMCLMFSISGKCVQSSLLKIGFRVLKEASQQQPFISFYANWFIRFRSSKIFHPNVLLVIQCSLFNVHYLERIYRWRFSHADCSITRFEQCQTHSNVSEFSSK